MLDKTPKNKLKIDEKILVNIPTIKEFKKQIDNCNKTTSEEPKLGFKDRSRSPEQLEAMIKQEKLGICAFCTTEKSVNKIIAQNDNWISRPNDFPYPLQNHYVLFAKEHLEMASITNLTSKQWQDFGQMNSQVIEKMNIPGGTIVMRFGDEKYNSCTMKHIHSHIQSPFDEEINNYYQKDQYLKSKDGFLLQELEQKKYWTAGLCQESKPNLSYQFGIILNRDTNELPSDSNVWSEFGELFTNFLTKYKLPGGGLSIRFGNPKYNNAKYQGVYACIYVPNLKGEVIDYFLTDNNDNPISKNIDGKKTQLFKATFAKSAKKKQTDAKKIEEFTKQLQIS